MRGKLPGLRLRRPHGIYQKRLPGQLSQGLSRRGSKITFLWDPDTSQSTTPWTPCLPASHRLPRSTAVLPVQRTESQPPPLPLPASLSPAASRDSQANGQGLHAEKMEFTRKESREHSRIAVASSPSFTLPSSHRRR